MKDIKAVEIKEDSTNYPEGHRVTLERVDGKTFTGEGKTKKEAKKNCAIEVLKLCHAIAFTNVKSE